MSKILGKQIAQCKAADTNVYNDHWSPVRDILKFDCNEGNIVEPSIMDTIGNQHFAPYSEVSLTQGLPVYFR